MSSSSTPLTPDAPGTITYTERKFSKTIALRVGEQIVAGRGMKSGIWLSDPTVAQAHAEIRWTGSEWVVRNLDQGNPTRHISNSGYEQAIESEMRLTAGMLRIGSATLSLAGKEA